MSTRIEPGLVFAIPISENLFGFGKLVAKDEPVFYMVGYDICSHTTNLTEEKLDQAKPLFVGNFFDVLIRSERWLPVMKLPIRNLPFPCFKVRIGDKFFIESWNRTSRREATSEELSILRFRVDHGPIILENALKAQFGFAPWDTKFQHLKIEEVAACAQLCR